MTTDAPASSSILRAPALAIATASAGLLEWSFDMRFRAAAATFPGANSAAVRTALEQGFDQAWTTPTIAQAPPRASELAGKLGGLRPGQILFGANAASDPILFGAWWPWGDGATISIRVLFSARESDQAGRDALLVEFKSWFGLPA